MFPTHTSATITSTCPSLYSQHSIPSTTQQDTKMKKPSMPLSTTLPPALSLGNLQQEWPLEEYQEKRIMNALSQQQQLLSPILDEECSDDDDTAEEDNIDSISPTASYFSDRALFQLNSTIRRQSLSNSLRCSICQRRFHSQGNLSNHTQLYHC